MNCRQWVVDAIPCRRPHADSLWPVASCQGSARIWPMATDR